MQTRDEMREQIQTQIRDAMRQARDAAREAANAADQPAIVMTPVDGNLMLDVLRGEIATTREEIRELTARVGTGNDRQQAVIDAQLTNANERLERLQERLERMMAGAPGEAISVQPDFPPGLDGDRIADIARNTTNSLFITIAAIAIGVPLVRAFARWLDRRGTPAPTADLGARLDRIEQAVDAVAVEMERVSESQRYASRLLGELRALPAPPAAGWTPPVREQISVRTTTPV